MYIKQSRLYDDFYEPILKSSLQSVTLGTIPIAIFVSLSVDSICACRILSSILKLEYIPHKIIPAQGFSDIQQANESFIIGNESLRFIVLINCGGLVDLEHTLEPEKHVKTFIFDSMRPINLDNALGSNSVYVMDDGDLEFGMKEVSEAYINYRKRRLELNEQKELEIESSVLSDDDLEIGNIEKDKQLQEWQQIIAEYYAQGTSKSSSVSCQMYTVAISANKEDNQMLWLAIVGMTSMYMRGEISFDKYSQQYRNLKEEVQRLNVSDNLSSRKANAITNANSCLDLSISLEEEYQFMLIRNWSLYNAMMHSPYFASRLRIYSPNGIKRLHKILAKIGFSIRECKQIYTFMDRNLKQVLREKLIQISDHYGLDELVIPGFIRHWGFKCTLSATDFCYALFAILEGGHFRSNKRKRGTIDTGIDDTELVDTQSTVDSSIWLQNFHEAYRSLQNVEDIQSAFSIAMKLQSIILKIGSLLIQKYQIKKLRWFRIGILKPTEMGGIAKESDLKVFSHPTILQRLAIWISTSLYNEEEGKSKHLPLVIACYNPKTNNYVVVGVSGSSDEKSRTKFGLAFQQVSNDTNCRVKIDSFEANVIECKKEDLGGFLESLCLFHN